MVVIPKRKNQIEKGGKGTSNTKNERISEGPGKTRLKKHSAEEGGAGERV